MLRCAIATCQTGFPAKFLKHNAHVCATDQREFSAPSNQMQKRKNGASNNKNNDPVDLLHEFMFNENAHAHFITEN